MYTGAPYFSATSALKVGADNIIIYTSEEAAISLKTLGPDYIVKATYSSKELNNITRNLIVQEIIHGFKWGDILLIG